MFCKNCGAKINANAGYCAKCGAKNSREQKSSNKAVWIILGVTGGTLFLAALLIFAVFVRNIHERTEEIEEMQEMQEEIAESLEEEFEDEMEDLEEDLKEAEEERKELQEEKEETAELSEQDAFEKIMQGSWLYYNERYGMYFKTFDGEGKIRCGYVESERMPTETINSVKRVAEDVYEVEVTSEEWRYDFDSDEVTPGQTYTLRLCSEGDRFRSIFHMENANGEKVYFVRMGNDFDEAYYDSANIERYEEAVRQYESLTAPTP